MRLFNKKLENIFYNKKAVKIISGIDNLNINNILEYIRVCEINKATYIDIVANPKIVYFIKQMTSLPICVSSINVKSLYDCVLAGADIVEIGNFDVFYKQGIHLSHEHIMCIAQQIRHLLPFTDICVTIPHIFTINQQIELALELEDLGINMLQTEGDISEAQCLDITENKSYLKDSITHSIKKASSSLSSVYLLSNKVSMPVIGSSGISSLTASIAFAYGASCIGIKSEISRFANVTDMSLCMNEMMRSLNLNIKCVNRNLNFNKSISHIDNSRFYSI
uniref:Uncharacterized protein ycf23 n=1 Tax=Ceramothamnion japonicum TaxID=218448 RepID=A0A1C9CD92_CERJP|nr:hypothetical protein Ceram_082 [Ceramium japonicum]AOM66358.1 hypothetical protein Ceram_082 [Ceramium japonicum]